MDKAQTDIPGDIPDNNQDRGSRNMGYAEMPANEVQLSDILKPTTLIIGIIVLVLIVLYGWYVVVLEPALHNNESMIHFMPSVQKGASNEAAKPIAIAPNETLVPSETIVPTPVPQLIAQPAPLSSENHSNNTVTSAPVKSVPSKTTHVANAKPISKHHHAHASRKQLQNNKTQNNQHLPTLSEEQKCTPAQIAMQQCATYP